MYQRIDISGSDNSLPEYWYNHLFAGTQMLLSFCYFASILGMALSPRQAQPWQRAWNASSRDFRRQVESAPVSSPDTSTLSGQRSCSVPQSQNGKNSSCCDGDNEKIVKESDDVPLLTDDLAYSKGESIVIIEPGDHGFDIR
ncbi:hypothetical protein PoB_002791300 [Plakobranchus ocellatus]|uniref:Uncharacterized protein n=1 Tax=Plakobranchus ocellatus TaxID=259542 RepID=A0AAV4A432_9GAST|nr:hypothetical protein PoB_002791300 [Plakobranchus ocellatus]